MSIKLALISGKGGSGKTTIGLSIAEMLSKSNKRILFIDCDLATHGATYFFEHLVENNNGFPSSSFYGIINSKLDKYSLKYISINENFYFLPSINLITKEYSENNFDALNIKDTISFIENQFDIIMFDCQAGYTKLLDTLLCLSDANLIVMEADAISSSALRVLYTKISPFINEKKTFQIFNKVSQEEYELYSKISVGTFFTNLTPILFNWEVRKSFALAQIPNMYNTDSNFGEEINILCESLFPQYTVEIRKFNYTILIRKKNEINFILDKKLKFNIFSKYVILISGVISIALSILYISFFSKNDLSSVIDIIISIVLPALVAFSLTFTFFNRDFKKQRNERGALISELSSINKKIDLYSKID